MRRDQPLKRPGLLILVIIWNFIIAALALFIIIITIITFSAEPTEGGSALIAILFWTPILCLSLAAGIGLIKGKSWGRTIAIIHAAINIIFPPVIGTIVGVFTLIYLLRSTVKEYFVAINRPRPITQDRMAYSQGREKRSPNVEWQAEIDVPVSNPAASADLVCPVCRASFTPEQRVHVCPECGVKHHKECWNMIRGCSTFGCTHASH